jgi:hypothetical protein
MRGLRLVIFDKTCVSGAGGNLSHVWRGGTALYSLLRRIDAAHGAASFEEAWRWVASVERDRPIDEVQFWGHGKWGRALIDRESLDRSALSPRHRLNPLLCAVRERLGPEALFWFRTCETFGASAGHAFAAAWSDFFGARSAGHTFIIGHWQSGLHSLSPGRAPHWSPREGLVSGTPDRPERAAWSGRKQPNTVSFLTGAVPESW